MEKTRLPQTSIIIGGGIIGIACALNLQARGIQTTVIDPNAVRRAASWGNAGHIAVEQVEPLASATTIRSFPRRLFWRGGALGLPLRDISAWLPFSLRFMRASRRGTFQKGKAALGAALAMAMPAWRRLLNYARAPHLLLEQGHFIVWETPEAAAAGRAAWLTADSGTARFVDATDKEIALLAGLTAQPLAGAIRCIGSGQVTDLGDLAAALDTRFEADGGRQRCASVTAIEQSSEGASVRLDSGETLKADVIVVAAGIASGRLLEPLGHKVPIIAERGYHLESPATNWPIEVPPVVFEERSMIVTRFRTGLRAASFVEFGRGSSPPDPRKWARLRAHVRALGLSLGEPIAQWMGARPTLPDYLPAIGRSDRAPNLFYAFGHQHLGLTLAAVTGEAIGALVAGDEPCLPLSPFSLTRFERNDR